METNTPATPSNGAENGAEIPPPSPLPEQHSSWEAELWFYTTDSYRKNFNKNPPDFNKPLVNRNIIKLLNPSKYYRGSKAYVCRTLFPHTKQGLVQLRHELKKKALMEGYEIHCNGGGSQKTEFCYRLYCCKHRPPSKKQSRQQKGQSEAVSKTTTTSSKQICKFSFIIGFDHHGCYIRCGIGNPLHCCHPKIDARHAADKIARLERSELWVTKKAAAAAWSDTTISSSTNTTSSTSTSTSTNAPHSVAPTVEEIDSKDEDAVEPMAAMLVPMEEVEAPSDVEVVDDFAKVDLHEHLNPVFQQLCEVGQGKLNYKKVKEISAYLSHMIAHIQDASTESSPICPAPIINGAKTVHWKKRKR